MLKMSIKYIMINPTFLPLHLDSLKKYTIHIQKHDTSLIFLLSWTVDLSPQFDFLRLTPVAYLEWPFKKRHKVDIWLDAWGINMPNITEEELGF